MSDGMLWAPWRAGFILKPKERGCIFCNRLRMKDSVKNLIVHRGKKAFVILNKYPYNAGHAMIVPNRHIGQIEKLSAAEAVEFFELRQKTVAAIKKLMNPQSLNLGMNIGKVSGAGIPGHVHMHVVPRWRGDTNFMPVVGETRVVSIPLGPIYKALRREFARP